MWPLPRPPRAHLDQVHDLDEPSPARQPRNGLVSNPPWLSQTSMVFPFQSPYSHPKGNKKARHFKPGEPFASLSGSFSSSGPSESCYVPSRGLQRGKVDKGKNLRALRQLNCSSAGALRHLRRFGQQLSLHIALPCPSHVLELYLTSEKIMENP